MPSQTTELAPSVLLSTPTSFKQPIVVQHFQQVPLTPEEPVTDQIQESKFLTMTPNIYSPGKPLSGATKLRRMIFETKDLIVCPGVYDGLSARTALEVGFPALYMVCTFASYGSFTNLLT